jgi:hypothetical protein
MNRIITATLLAAATTAASWFVTRWLDRRYERVASPPHKPIESWENEGGAMAPQHAPMETSQVPR